jgi:hypothetical protein
MVIRRETHLAELAWGSRDELLAEIAADPDAAGIVRAFKGAGASAPVRIGSGDKQRLASAIGRWVERVDALPAGVWELQQLPLDDIGPP